MSQQRWRLDGQLALVTGGSAGIGRAIARELLGFGARVLIAARDGNGLDAVRIELEEEFPDGEVRTFVSDVSDDVSEGAARVGGDAAIAEPLFMRLSQREPIVGPLPHIADHVV